MQCKDQKIFLEKLRGISDKIIDQVIYENI